LFFLSIDESNKGTKSNSKIRRKVGELKPYFASIRYCVANIPIKSVATNIYQFLFFIPSTKRLEVKIAKKGKSGIMYHPISALLVRKNMHKNKYRNDGIKRNLFFSKFMKEAKKLTNPSKYHPSKYFLFTDIGLKNNIYNVLGPISLDDWTNTICLNNSQL
jgi:hypothetical protein